MRRSTASASAGRRRHLGLEQPQRRPPVAWRGRGARGCPRRRPRPARARSAAPRGRRDANQPGGRVDLERRRAPPRRRSRCRARAPAPPDRRRTRAGGRCRRAARARTSCAAPPIDNPPPPARRRAARAPPAPAGASAACACPVRPPPHGLSRGKRALSRQRMPPPAPIARGQRDRRRDARRPGARDDDVAIQPATLAYIALRAVRAWPRSCR